MSASESQKRIEPLTFGEVQLIAETLAPWRGAQLQEVQQTTQEFGLGFYHQRSVQWLWFDLDPRRPLVVRLARPPGKRKKITRPVSLFVRSRVLGRRLKSVRVDADLGRVLIFEFHRSQEEGASDPVSIEVRLFPHGQNVIIRDGEKSISENKPKEMPVTVRSIEPERVRSWEDIENLWLGRDTDVRKDVVHSGTADAGASQEKLKKDFERAIEKKTLALERMRTELAAKQSSSPSEVGEWLKTQRSLEVPVDRPEWRGYIDPEKSLSWNIEACFRKSKENARKLEGAEARILKVETEIDDLRRQGVEGFLKLRENESRKKAGSLLASADARGRRFEVAGNLEAYVGRSAADNLSLLRRAQPFDYWLHLRDLPGSHAILRRSRGRDVTDQEFEKVGRWVVEQSIGKPAHELSGEQFDLLIVECRYVKPIKGDKLGRVNYTHDRVFRVRF